MTAVAEHQSAVPVRPARLLRQSVNSVGLTGVMLCLNVLTGIILARGLGVDGRGAFTAVTLAPSFITWIVSIGCSKAVSYHQSVSPKDGGALLSTWLVILIPLSIFGIIVGEIVISFTLDSQSADTRHLAELFMAIVISGLATELFYGLLLGDHDFTFVAATRAVQPAALAALYLVTVATVGLTVGLAVLALGAVAVAVNAACFIRILSRRKIASPDWALGRSTLAYGLKAQGANAGDIANQRLDLLLLPAFVSAASIGLYSVAASIAGLLAGIASAMSPIVLASAARDRKRANEITLVALSATFGLGAAVAIVVVIVGPLAIDLVYGPQFGGSYEPLVVLLPGAIAYSCALVCMSGLFALNAPLRALRAQLIGACVTIAGLALFLRDFGMMAAAWVSTVAYTVVFVVAAREFAKGGGLTRGDFRTARVTLRALMRRLADGLLRRTPNHA